MIVTPIEVADNRRLFELIGGLFDRLGGGTAYHSVRRRVGRDGRWSIQRRALYLIWQDPG